MFHCNFIYFFIIISTHAPAWGATCTLYNRETEKMNFYSRLREGGDSCWWTATDKPTYFYSRPRVGGDAYTISQFI